MIIGHILFGAGFVLLLVSALFALYDAARAHFLKRAEVDGRTRMKLWPLWTGIAGGALLFIRTFMP